MLASEKVRQHCCVRDMCCFVCNVHKLDLDLSIIWPELAPPFSAQFSHGTRMQPVHQNHPTHLASQIQIHKPGHLAQNENSHKLTRRYLSERDIIHDITPLSKMGNKTRTTQACYMFIKSSSQGHQEASDIGLTRHRKSLCVTCFGD